MSQYDGLNLPELLALMHGLVTPAPVAWLPLTLGWWIAAAWLLVVMVIVGWALLKRRCQNRYRRDALAELRTIESETDLGPAESAQRIAALLKRTALVAYPRAQVAALFGHAWAEFLRESAPGDKQVAGAADKLAAAAYKPDADGSELSRPARRWIQVHRA